MSTWHPIKALVSTQRRRRLLQAAIAGLLVALVMSGVQWAGLFSSTQASASDYLYSAHSDPGEDIVIVAIDEKSLQTLGDWPWALSAYVPLFEYLAEADVVGFDVLLPDPGPLNNPDAAALVQAVRAAGNVVMPLASLELHQPQASGDLYVAGQTVRPFPDLLQAAADAGMVAVVQDVDGRLRRVPLLIEVGGNVVEAFNLRILCQRAALYDVPSALEGNNVVLGDEYEVKFRIPTDTSGAMLVNFVGVPNTFPSYSFVDVTQGKVAPVVFRDKIVLVGMMDTVGEMDLHQTPISARRMSGIEFQANALHTLFTHRALIPESRAQTILTIVVLSLISALVLSQLGAALGAVFTIALVFAYFLYTNWRFDSGMLPNVLIPYATILLCYAVATAVRFAVERVDRLRVADVFGRFVSAEVRDQIVQMALDAPDLVRPGGQLREISVLFADIRGFTRISENLSPSEVVEILNLYLNSMEEQVFKHSGTLDKYTGDGMMVIFGAPLAQPDHAERAVRAALDMQRAAAEVSELRCRMNPECDAAQWEVGYGIGITTGPAVVGQIGSRRRLDYTAIGDTVNLAARLEGQAPSGTVLISDAAYAVVKDLFEAEALAPMMVKNKAEPVQAYRVLGAKGEK
ncbi:MAG: adenylate/guanylate cyclase domain-containing protein [Anaerolineae bacterium]|nr:adenylate/guanylate cyclase domain-containing protein [Anaerolineae bacterium]